MSALPTGTDSAIRFLQDANLVLALIVLPTLIVGNELLILAGVAASVGLWFLAHRHGQLRGLVDVNKNGID